MPRSTGCVAVLETSLMPSALLFPRRQLCRTGDFCCVSPKSQVAGTDLVLGTPATAFLLMGCHAQRLSQPEPGAEKRSRP